MIFSSSLAPPPSDILHKNLSKNIKQFSGYLENSSCMSWNKNRKTAEIPLQSMPIWYLFQILCFSPTRLHNIESLDIFYFASGPGNVLQKILVKQILWFFLLGLPLELWLRSELLFWDLTCAFARTSAINWSNIGFLFWDLASASGRILSNHWSNFVSPFTWLP